MKHIIILLLVFLSLILSANVHAEQQVTIEIEGMTCKL
jgi:hypothetical protein